MTQPIITLTTDFGPGSHYVGQMKGVILSINPDAKVVDLCHAVAPQDVRQGAQVLADAAGMFPRATIHVAVVDPGVGTERKIIYARVGDQQFIAPDNGLLSLVAKKTPPSLKIALSNRRFWRQEVSPTFHGRDIMAPAAAHLSLGLDPRRLGEPVEALVHLNLPSVHVDAKEIRGAVVSFDTFGNLITDITRDMLAEAQRSDRLRVQCGGHSIHKLVRTYGAGPPQALVALVGSSGMLELAVVNGNAAQKLGVQVGTEVAVTW